MLTVAAIQGHSQEIAAPLNESPHPDYHNNNIWSLLQNLFTISATDVNIAQISGCINFFSSTRCSPGNFVVIFTCSGKPRPPVFRPEPVKITILDF
jgi:hypothetical protein